MSNMTEHLDYNATVKYFWEKLGTSAIMQLASSVENHVSVRTVSCIMYTDENRIMFKTDKNFEKTKQLAINSNVAMCKYNVNVEGVASNLGLVVDEPGRKFEELYKLHLDGSYNNYSHEDTEVLIAVDPTMVEIWDCDENNFAFHIYIDFENKTAIKYWYDERN